MCVCVFVCEDSTGLSCCYLSISVIVTSEQVNILGFGDVTFLKKHVNTFVHALNVCVCVCVCVLVQWD